MVFTGDFEDDLANTMNSESNRRQAMRSVCNRIKLGARSFRSAIELGARP
jgi:hypothetical protein